MTDDIDKDAPASEQFDLSKPLDYISSADEIDQLATELEAAEDLELWPTDDETLAEYVAALKRLEDAAEEARKEAFEAELSSRVEEGETVGPVRKQRGSHSYVTDAEAAFAAVADAGADPLDVASVKVGDLRDVLGAQADEYLGSSEYEYFVRDA